MFTFIDLSLVIILFGCCYSLIMVLSLLFLSRYMDRHGVCAWRYCAMCTIERYMRDGFNR